MTTPWFMECLGLPAHADDRAVRRAYASRLKQIDPAQDPAAFAQLREAYDTARAWIADDPQGAVAPPLDANTTPPAAAHDDPAPFIVQDEPADQRMPPLANPVEQAAALVDRFATRVASGSEPRAELEACTAELRLQYIDAPGMFEELLVDRLAQGPLSARPEVFAAAWDHFHWQEIGHLASMGGRGGWIDAVETQRSGWTSVAEPQRDSVLATIRSADAAGSPLPIDIVRNWTDVREAFQHFGTYLALFIAPATLNEWVSRYQELPPASWQITDRARPEPPSRMSRFRSRLNSRWSYVALVAICVLCRIVMELLGVDPSARPSSTETPVATAPAADASAVTSLTRDPPKVRVIISPSAAARTSARVRVSVTNVGDSVVYLSKVMTPLVTPGDHLGRPLFSVIDQRGKTAPFNAMVMPMPAHHLASSYLLLAPGQTLSHELDLAASYRLTKGDTYRVHYLQQVTTSSDVNASGYIQGVDDYVSSNEVDIPVR